MLTLCRRWRNLALTLAARTLKPILNTNPDVTLAQVVSSRDPLALPWKEMDIDLVIEGTGVFVDSKGAGKHIEARSPSLLALCRSAINCCHPTRPWLSA